ncbi:MAG: transcriptional regulator [Rubrivivax sp. SCN 71-131]|nr:MAG: transcriptional regulator [Rubrivivax sp. SCN 71-131]
MLPATLTIVDDDEVYGEHLAAHLRRQGVRVRSFADSNHLLTAPEPFGDAFYVLDLMLPGVGGEELIRILRLRSDAGVLVVSGKAASGVFEDVLSAGADMHVAKPVSLEQITLAIEAIWRRIEQQRGRERRAWLLDIEHQRLTAPGGEVIELADNDLAILSCFPDAEGGVVTRERLCQSLGRPVLGGSDNALHAMIYRLRRRIEKATSAVVPLQSQSRVGYVFKAPIRVQGRR